MRVKDDLFR